MICLGRSTQFFIYFQNYSKHNFQHNCSMHSSMMSLNYLDILSHTLFDLMTILYNYLHHDGVIRNIKVDNLYNQLHIIYHLHLVELLNLLYPFKTLHILLGLILPQTSLLELSNNTHQYIFDLHLLLLAKLLLYIGPFAYDLPIFQICYSPYILIIINNKINTIE